MQATLTFLGSGTSMGVPTLGCPCAVCADARLPGSKNRRTRPSVKIDWDGNTVLIDTGPDFHAQAIRERITHLDAVFYTHHHADHILGMDDLRPLTFRNPTPLPLFADQTTAAALERVFGYTFREENRYPTSARVAIHRLEEAPGAAITLFGATFRRIPVIHGRERITGYRFGAAAYLTDMSDIPEESLPLLQNLDLLILDALRPTPHPSHSHLEKSIAFVDLLKPRRAFFTHMGHEIDHDSTNATLPPHIRLAHDGLQLPFTIAEEPSNDSASNPFSVGDLVKFNPSENAIGKSWSSFDRLRLHPGDEGLITRIQDNYIYLDDERGGFHWECFKRSDDQAEAGS